MILGDTQRYFFVCYNKSVKKAVNEPKSVCLSLFVIKGEV